VPARLAVLPVGLAQLGHIVPEPQPAQGADADSIRHRARCIPSRARREVDPLKPGDVCIVNHVNPVDGLTVVERVNTMGQRDGTQYKLIDYQLAAKSEPA
jgi:hypothetical protein